MPEDVSPFKKWAGQPSGSDGMGGATSKTDTKAYDPTVKPGPFAEIGASGLAQYGGFVREEFLPQLSGDNARKVYREMYDNDPIVGAVVFAIQMLVRKVEWRVEPAEAGSVEEIVEERMQERMQAYQERMQAQQQRVAEAQAGLAGNAQQGNARGAGPGGKAAPPAVPHMGASGLVGPAQQGAGMHEPISPTPPNQAGPNAPMSTGTNDPEHTGVANTEGSNPLTNPGTNPGGGPAQAAALEGNFGLGSEGKPDKNKSGGFAKAEGGGSGGGGGAGGIDAQAVGTVPIDPETNAPMEFGLNDGPQEMSPEARKAEELAVFVETCHPAGTRMMTDEGQRTIESLIIGDIVLTHEGRWLPVTETMSFDYTGSMVELKRAYTNRPIRATADHHLYVSKRPVDWHKRNGTGRGGVATHDLAALCKEWLPISTLVAGDWLLEPVPNAPTSLRDDELIWEFASQKMGRPASGNRSIYATNDLCRLVGYYLAEGSRDRGSINFAFHSDEVDYHKDVEALVASVFGTQCSIRPRWGGGQCSVVWASSAIASRFFGDEVPGTASTKSVPRWIFDLSDEAIVQLLLGYFRGDGNWTEGDRISVATISAQLAEDTRQLLLRLGIVASIRSAPRTSGYGKIKRDVWTVTVSGLHAIKLAELFEIPWGRNRGRTQAFIHDGYVHYPILSTTTTSEALKVYNIEVEKDHSYIAEGVASHNCFHDMADSWADSLAQIMTMVVFGFAFHEIVYKKRNGPNPDVPYQGSKFSDGKVGWANLAGRAQETLFRWEFDDNGNILGFWQLAPPKFQLRYIPLAKAVLFRTTSYKNNPEGRSIFRSAYRPWFFKKRVEEYESIGVERDLAGLPMMRVPYQIMTEGATPEEKASLQAAQKLVRNVRANQQAGLVIPTAFDPDSHERVWDFELLSASGGSRAFDTDKIITRYDQRIAMTSLADVLLLGHDSVGARSLGETKVDLFTSALEAWLNSIADDLNTQAIPKLMQINGEDPAMCPRLTHGKLAPISLEEIASLITALSGAGADLFPDAQLEDFIREEAGLPPKAASMDL